MSARTKILAHCFSNIYAWISGQQVGATSTSKSKHRPVLVRELYEISEILNGRLYLSGASALTAEKLQSLGITAIVCALTEIEEKHLSSASYTEASVPKMYVRIFDSESCDISAHFDSVAKFIDDEIAGGGKVLVHCVAGMSRSATLVLAYLIRYKNLSLMDAYDYVADRRRIIEPNDGFFCQLAKYERRLKTKEKLAIVNELSEQVEETDDMLSDDILALSLRDEPIAAN